MKKEIVATVRRIAVILIVALMGVGWAMAAQAAPSQQAEGLWEYMPRPPAPTDPPPIFLNCEDLPYPFLMPMITMLTEDGRWSGTFNGMSVDTGTLIIRCEGSFSFWATVAFESVMVNGNTGRLYMHVEGTKPDPFADWCGTWSIIDGMGDMENLQGQGSWWGPGYTPVFPDVWGQIHYDGKIKWSRAPLHEMKREKCLNHLCDDDGDDD